MRTNIFQISQQFAVKKGLDVVDVLIIDYMLTFFGSGFALPYRETIGGSEFGRTTIYHWITPKKILEDLPILNIKERMLIRRLERLEEKNIIRRTTKKNRTYINFPNPMEFM